MPDQLKYSSGLNGAAFLMFELKQIIKLKIAGFNDKDIRAKVTEENTFQFNNSNRITRVLPTLMRRAQVLDNFLGKAFIERTAEVSKALNLYVIMKTDLLFFEFMDEVIKQHFQDNDFYLEKKEINLFFNAKAEQNATVSSWSDTNQEKLKRAILTVLFESGILIKRNDGDIKPLTLDEDVKQHLLDIGDRNYVEDMGEVVT